MPGIPPIAIAAIAAATTGAAGIAQAVSQNQAADKQDDAARRSAEVQTKQLREQAELEAKKRVRDARTIRGAILARDSVADEALTNQVDQDLALNLDILGKNRDAAFARVASGLDAQLAETTRTNPLLAGFTGGMGGFGAGLSIGTSLQSANAYSQMYPSQTPSISTQSGPVFGDPLDIRGAFA